MAEPAPTAKTMQAIVCTNFGPPKEVLQAKSIPIPEITKQDSVLIKVLYASMNPIDYKIISGMMGPVVPFKPPFIVGRDVSGRVAAKGDDVKEFDVGDLVYGQCWGGGQGSFAEYCVVSSKTLNKIPKSISPFQAAAVPLISQTSYQAAEKMALKKGDKLLILGGSTSVGLAEIQIAKNHFECGEVIVTSSQEALCKSLGADRVVNYKKEKWQNVLKDCQVDAIYDCVGGRESWDDCRSQNVLKHEGHYVTLVGDSTNGGKITTGTLIGGGLSILNRKFWGANGYQKYDVFLQDKTKNLDDVSALIHSDKLKPVLDERSPFKLENFMEVFDISMSHKAKGKLVIAIGDDEKLDENVENDNKEDDIALEKEKVEDNDTKDDTAQEKEKVENNDMKDDTAQKKEKVEDNDTKDEAVTEQ